MAITKSVLDLLIKYFGVFYRKIPWYLKGKGFFQRVLFSKLLQGRNHHVVVKMNVPYKPFLLCCLDDWLPWQVFIDGFALGERLVSREMFKRLNKKSIVFDVGANIGYYSIIFGMIASKGEVHAFEPLSRQRNLLKSSIHINKLSNVRVIDKIVSDTNDQQRIFYSGADNTGASSLHLKGEDFEDVKSITLDYYCDQCNIHHIDLMKIDVEGHELNVLKGMSNLLRLYKVKSLFIEILDSNLLRNNTKVDDVVSFLNKFGYKGYSITSKGIVEYDGFSNQSLVLFLPVFVA